MCWSGKELFKMTSLRRDAHSLLEQIPEDKLTFVIQIMQGVNGLYQDDRKEREDAFNRLERIRRKNNNLDYDAELASYREEKYGSESVS